MFVNIHFSQKASNVHHVSPIAVDLLVYFTYWLANCIFYQLGAVNFRNLLLIPVTQTSTALHRLGNSV